MRRFRLALTIVVCCLGWTTAAAALTAEVPTRDPSVVGEAYAFRAVVSGEVGATLYRWNFGDGTPADFVAGASDVTHTYTQPGHYPLIVTIKDQSNFTSVAFVHIVHYPITARAPSASTDIVYDTMRKRVCNVNEDDDSVSITDAVGLTAVAEIPVYQRPVALAIAPGGKLWVVHRDDYAVAIVDLDRFTIERGFRLPYASQPVGLAMSPTGDAAYVTLMALGKLAKLDPATGNVLATADIGSWARGVSVTQDGKDVYVTRFISSGDQGEILHVDAASMKVVARIALAPDTTKLDSDQGARGAPNYLFSTAISPDGRQAWVPGKSDNIFRGAFRDKQDLNQDDTVRPMVAILDLAQGMEERDHRIDLDDRNLPSHVEWSPLGDYAFVTATGSALIELVDAYTNGFVTALERAGIAPRGSVLGPNGRLFVHGSLSRNIVVFDVADILTATDQTTKKVAEIPAVTKTKLGAEPFRGKQVFYNSSDSRMTDQGYISCASCHFEAFEDGRVWDLTNRGEGLRNTTSLLGRRGTGEGRIHWSGNFDEVQDFEQEIRGLFNGSGFIADGLLAVGTRSDPLGDPKAGLSPDLDAVAAYLGTLDHVDPSPYRNSDGSMTADAIAGKAVLLRLGCDFCHVGKDFSDSSRGMLHDVGTIKPSSGTRSGKPLLGIDTPTLLGIWETAPYLHDGSAPTLRDVLTTANPRDEHGFVSSLSPQELDQLIAYLLQLDDELPIRRLPFEPALPADAGAGSSDSGTAGRPPPSHTEPGHCGCELAKPRANPPLGALAVFAAVLMARRRRRPFTRRLAGASLLIAAAACSDGSTGSVTRVNHDAGDGPVPAPSWSHLPPVSKPDPELSRLPSREAQYDKLCAQGRTDAFFKLVCRGFRPNIVDLAGLVRLVGLDRNRSFALSGNSTSLVARSVSALNPRILVFPRVPATLEPPEELIAIGFVRGERFVEVASRDPNTRDLNLYLLSFEQGCSYDGSCDLASLLTEQIEHEWTAYSIYSEKDLEATSFDCHTCHQPAGFGTPDILRMQELTSPWLHWFPQRYVQRTDSDRILTAQFLATHDVDGQYGSVPIQAIAGALGDGGGAELEALIRAEGYADQPNVFDPRIEEEAKDGRASPTWLAQFQVAVRGDAIAVPYPRADVTDETKRLAAVQSYRGVVTGVAPRESLLDVREVFSQDAIEKLSFVPQPGADGRSVLLQMCSRCHDGRADPAAGRSRFNVQKLDQMSRDEKDVAIDRLQQPATSWSKMPPWRSGHLPDEAIQAAIQELRK